MKNRALIVGANMNNSQFEYSFQELRRMVESMNYKIVGEFVQNIKQINEQYYIGQGKMDELIAAINFYNADIVIFDNELSPSQYSNILDRIPCDLLDRTGLILEIFKSRATTYEAKLQIQIARLQYELPRLRDEDADYSQQVGGGARNKGEGEKQIQLAKSRLRKQIHRYEMELESIKKNRSHIRKRRGKNDIPQVALVGYTNSGKSTIMNRFVKDYGANNDKTVIQKDMLFATLETYSRRITLPQNLSFILKDTVGFISNLPTFLIKAFRSTLEEALDSDLLVIVVDSSDPNIEAQLDVTVSTLQELGVGDTPVIFVFNKADIQFDKDYNLYQNMISMSALKDENMFPLINEIKKYIFKDYIRLGMFIPYENISDYYKINDEYCVTSRIEDNDGIMIRLYCPAHVKDKYKKYVME